MFFLEIKILPSSWKPFLAFCINKKSLATSVKVREIILKIVKIPAFPQPMRCLYSTFDDGYDRAAFFPHLPEDQRIGYEDFTSQ
jgi:hypothetical protein